MRRRRPPATCACGVAYRDFRTGETFASVRKLMRDDPHPVHGGWRQKRRNGVLGYWRALKIQMFECAHGHCEIEAEAELVRRGEAGAGRRSDRRR